MTSSIHLKHPSAMFLKSAASKKSVYILSALLLIACQPSPPTSEPVTAENSEAFNTPLLIRADSITMTPDHILSVKPTRYQPSLGLEGNIESIKQVNFIAAQALSVEQVLVNKNQWVKKGTALFTVRRQEVPLETTNLEVNLTNQEVPTENVKENKVSRKSVDGADSANGDLIDDDLIDNDSVNANVDDAQTAAGSYNLITVRASFSGLVEELYIKNGQPVAQQQPLLTLSDESELHFIAALPIETKSQLSVGQTVNFTAEGLIDTFTGQVSKLTATEQPRQLLVNVKVVNNDVSRNQIRPNMKVTGRVDYGQIEVGTIVPKQALHNVDLTVLHKPPYKPLRRLTANVWIIKQNQRLTRQPVEVIEYDPLTKQYLIAGITNDSLICLANLPVESEGKKAVVS